MENVVQKSIDRLSDILRKYPKYESISLTGKETGTCIVSLSGNLEDGIKGFKEFLDTVPKDYINPESIQCGRKSVKFEIPLESFEGVKLPVQILFKSSDESRMFEENISNLEAEKRILIQALVQTSLLKSDPESTIKTLGVGKVPALVGNQEYRFGLNNNGLTLNIVDLDDDEIYTVWETANWMVVKKLLSGFDLDKDFDGLLADVAALDSKTKNAIRAILSSELNVDGEENNVRTVKVNNVLGEAEISEDTSKVAVVLGDFRPPHKKWFNLVSRVATKVGRVIIYVSSDKVGIPISAEQAIKVWNIYRKYINTPVEIRKVENESEVVEFINNPELSETRFIVYSQNPVDLGSPNSSLKRVDISTLSFEKKLEGKSIEKILKELKVDTWIPDELTREDSMKVIEILTQPLETQRLNESFKKQIVNTLVGVSKLDEASSGTPISPSVGISSEKRDLLSNLYSQLQDQLKDYFNVQFNSTCIVIKPRYATEMSTLDYDKEKLYERVGEEEFNYVPYITSYLQFMQKEGRVVQPLPEIILNKEKQAGDLITMKTGDYDPVNKVVTLYSKDRNPKDVLRSFAHEMEHHIQCLEGRIGEVKSDQVTEDKDLENLEAEAYQKGNISFRKWTESKRS